VRARVRRYLVGLLGRVERKNGWQLALVPSVIADVAREEDVDLIAIATHGSGGATRLLMGSVATGDVQRATVPVLVVRPPQGAPVLAEELVPRHPTTETRLSASR
jgi:hypothetical protein